MKSTGIVRSVDDLGRIVIPKEIRNTHGIKVGEPMEIYVDGKQIILQKHEPGCVFCGKLTDKAYMGQCVCPKCAKAVGV